MHKKIFRNDMIRCSLCKDAPCNEACQAIKPSDVLRSIWFNNERYIASVMPDVNPCINCDAPCVKNCIRSGEVDIKKLIGKLYDEVTPGLEVADPGNLDRLKTDFCGIPLENPFLLSSSVVASTYDMCARAFDFGWAGICFKTICTLDIHEASPRYSAIAGDNGTLIGFKNIEQLSDHTVEENMEIFRRLKQNYPTKFILASKTLRGERCRCC